MPQYGYIYNDTLQTVAAEDALTFSANGVMTSGLAHTAGTSNVTIAIAGDYKIAFSASVTGVNQTALFLNGVAVPGTTYGAGAGTAQNTGEAILTVAANDIITVRNHSTAGAYALATPIGGTQPTVNASLTIQKIS